MVIYMRHPIHGNKVATLEAEAEADALNGWEQYTLESTEPESVAVNELAKPRGRPRKELAA
jgi:hypothetical protein